ncbi:endolytic transglycosylase MltG [Campylobacter sp. FMV-PI01]|uniref:Endolytic murein transglycosylase n=1 Tax=Campylobacter portucalensis TaxID=2608384 RepID=A0A6L5WHC7_9BACT|nr:endolytic transglycosylase MltG [Campylobacter portucalensis]MSN96286.1 endolytic transglycosylase MltG [Campylobacter portucalensis]
MTTIVKIIFAIFDIIFILTLAFIIDLTAPTPFKNEIFIPKGSATKIISHLSKQNFNATIFDSKILEKIGKIQSGYLNLEGQNLTKIDFFYQLTKAKPVIDEITLIPGETTIVTLKNIAKEKNLDFIKLEIDFNQTAPFYEGFLVPETYYLPKGLKESEIIKFLVEKSKIYHKNLSKEILGDFNKTKWQEILIIASIIQKEAANAKEMPIISSVIQNRLKKNMRLQMDGTLNYGEFSHQKITPWRIKNDKSHFNTYLNNGLPKSAICLVSKQAIKAAINPIESEFLYFVRDKKTGAHIFTKSLHEHLKAINLQKNIK